MNGLPLMPHKSLTGLAGTSAQALERIGEPAGARTQDLLIKSLPDNKRKYRHFNARHRDCETGAGKPAKSLTQVAGPDSTPARGWL
jgi:hypothetical protein